MLKTLAAAAAILFAGHAAAQCKDMEYAQIKDMLATPEGKKKVYLERCFADVMTAHLYTLGGPANATKATACASLLTKIDTALTAAGDTDGLAFAAGRLCQQAR